MSNKTNNPQAFPLAWRNPAGVEFVDCRNNGMTIRDYFAAKAMQADLFYQGLEGREDVLHIAGMAYQMADAMLAERMKGDAA